MKNIVIGIVAHVDAGKTTLSEAMLYRTGSIRKLGRVDQGNAFLDTDTEERDRGITIFSKQAELTTAVRTHAAGYAGTCGFFRGNGADARRCWTTRCWSSAAGKGFRATP